MNLGIKKLVGHHAMSLVLSMATLAALNMGGCDFSGHYVPLPIYNGDDDYDDGYDNEWWFDGYYGDWGYDDWYYDEDAYYYDEYYEDGWYYDYYYDDYYEDAYYDDCCYDGYCYDEGW